MNTRTHTYKRHRHPPDIIQYAVWLYFRFNLSHRDIEDLLHHNRMDSRLTAVSEETSLSRQVRFRNVYR
jgi:transposase-like protein